MFGFKKKTVVPAITASDIIKIEIDQNPNITSDKLCDIIYPMLADGTTSKYQTKKCIEGIMLCLKEIKDSKQNG